MPAHSRPRSMPPIPANRLPNLIKVLKLDPVAVISRIASIDPAVHDDELFWCHAQEAFSIDIGLVDIEDLDPTDSLDQNWSPDQFLVVAFLETLRFDDWLQQISRMQE